MTRIRVAIVLPYHLHLPDGEYPVSSPGGSMALQGTVVATSPGQPARASTEVGAVFEEPEGAAEAAARAAIREARSLLINVNRVIRWYRQLASCPAVFEVTRAQASPFRFTICDSGQPWSFPSLEYEEERLAPSAASSDELGRTMYDALATGQEPDVADLSLLDAEYARSTGRFREAVLLCWTVIDSSFVRKFHRLVDSRLAEEWGDAQQFLKGFDFGLRHKMTSGLRLVAGRSLFEEPDDFWRVLSESYAKRNAIVHEGQPAGEEDAEQAIKVARRILEIVRSL
jgi:hypothetical protein